MTRPLTPAQFKAKAVTEAHVQQAYTQFLELDGWRHLRTDPVSDRKRGKGFGEPGMPDDLFIRYEGGDQERALKELRELFGVTDLTKTKEQLAVLAEVLWVEFKRKGKKPKPHQDAWHERELARGALIQVVDDIETGIAWYKASGLARKR